MGGSDVKWGCRSDKPPFVHREADAHAEKSHVDFSAFVFQPPHLCLILSLTPLCTIEIDPMTGYQDR